MPASFNIIGQYLFDYAPTFHLQASRTLFERALKYLIVFG
jgi:hypothetical protein